MSSFQRMFLIVMDSVGIGALPDAARFHDEGAHTLKHIAEEMGGLHLPQMERLGLGNIEAIQGVAPVPQPLASYGKMMEISAGKDTMTGHWELMGLKVEVPFRTFTDTGFPRELIEALEKETGRNVIGNKAASGTVIIEELGKEQMETGALIVYTSSDSVLQIAAHEDVIPLEELYQICEYARRITLEEPYTLGRIIARPYIGRPGAFERTANRKDYALKPYEPTVMNALENGGYDVIALGKINDIYDGEGVTKAIKTKSNMDGMDQLICILREEFRGLCFLNLVDFDALFGHRRNPHGYGRALQEFDERLAEVLTLLRNDDLLLITADHGNDPTHHGTDHTREYVPLLAYTKNRTGRPLGIRETFADVGATIADNFQVKKPVIGKSFLGEI